MQTEQNTWKTDLQQRQFNFYPLPRAKSLGVFRLGTSWKHSSTL